MNTCGATPPTATRIVTVILDVTPIRDRRGLSRLLDMIPGRSKKVFQTWLASQPHTWRERIEVVAMDGFTGFKSAAAEELPDATAVMDPFHVVHLSGDALDECADASSKNPPSARPGDRPPLQGPQDAPHQILPAHPTPTTPDPRPIRQRLPRRPRSHLERLPEHYRRLPRSQ